jgi:hypothetical protein
MKYLMIAVIFGLLIIMASCSNGENEKPHNVIVKYIKEHLGEPDSYDPIDWDSIKPVFIMKRNTRAYLDINDSIFKLLTDMDESFRQNNGRPIFTLHDSVYRIVNKLKSQQRKYEEGVDSSITVGYSIRHKYRAKNEYGAVEVMNRNFKLNKNMDTVITYN